MWEELTDAQREWKATCRRFAAEVIAPRRRRYDELNAFPREVHDEAHAWGLMNVGFPVELGGRGFDFHTLVIGGEELASVCSPIAFTLGFNHGSLRPVMLAGTDAQKRRLVGETIGRRGYASICLSEPDRSGSNLLEIDTRAVRRGERWAIDGCKCMVGNGAEASLFLVMADAVGEDGARLGPTFFAVPRGPGVKVGPNTDKVGFRCLTTPTVTFTGVEVGDEDRIGPVGEGEAILTRTLEVIRLGGASVILGITVGAVRDVADWIDGRQVWPGEPLAAKSHVQLQLGEIYTEIQAVRLLLWNAARRLDAGLPCATEASMAKLRASELAVAATARIVQLHGWRGLDGEWSIQKRWRDARVTTIYEGTSEIQLLTAFRALRESLAGEGTL